MENEDANFIPNYCDIILSTSVPSTSTIFSEIHEDSTSDSTCSTSSSRGSGKSLVKKSKRLLAIEKDRIELIRDFNVCCQELVQLQRQSLKLQTDRNELLKQLLDKL